MPCRVPDVIQRRPTLHRVREASQASYPAEIPLQGNPHRRPLPRGQQHCPQAPPTPQPQGTNRDTAPLNYSPEFTYPASPRGLPPPGTWERPPGATLLIDPATLFWRRFGWTGLVGGIPFPAKFTRALLLPPCQTALPCTGTQRYVRRRATRPPRKPPETSYPVRTLPRPTASSKPAQPRDHVRPAYPAAHRRRRRIDISLRAALYGRFVMGNRGEERLTLSGSWQQGHSTAYRTVSHS